MCGGGSLFQALCCVMWWLAVVGDTLLISPSLSLLLLATVISPEMGNVLRAIVCVCVCVSVSVSVCVHLCVCVWGGGREGGGGGEHPNPAVLPVSIVTVAKL